MSFSRFETSHLAVTKKETKKQTIDKRQDCIIYQSAGNINKESVANALENPDERTIEQLEVENINLMTKTINTP